MCHTRRVATLLCHIAAAFEAACQVDSMTGPFDFATFCPVRIHEDHGQLCLKDRTKTAKGANIFTCTEVVQKCRELSSLTGIDLFQALKVSPFKNK